MPIALLVAFNALDYCVPGGLTPSRLTTQRQTAWFTSNGAVNDLNDVLQAIELDAGSDTDSVYGHRFNGDDSAPRLTERTRHRNGNEANVGARVDKRGTGNLRSSPQENLEVLVVRSPPNGLGFRAPSSIQKHPRTIAHSRHSDDVHADCTEPYGSNSPQAAQRPQVGQVAYQVHQRPHGLLHEPAHVQSLPCGQRAAGR